MLRIGLLLPFIVVPVAELAILISLGGWIGLWPTVGVILGTAVLGATMLRLQGLGTLARLTAALNAGETPVVPMIEGALLIVAGALLLTPGLMTDAAGALLLIPKIRQALARRGLAYAVAHGTVHVGRATFRGQRSPGAQSRSADDPQRGQPHAPPSAGTVIDGDFERIDERTVPPRD
ncbi:MAG: FxsA family protein [Hyphomicrobiaceae bacterium]